MKYLIYLIAPLFFVSCNTPIDETIDANESTVNEKTVKDRLKTNHKSPSKTNSPDSISVEKGLKKISHPKAIGIWQISKKGAYPSYIKKEGPDSISVLHTQFQMPYTFKYDGVHITGQFFIRNGTAFWMSSDDHYKLETFWRKDSLFYKSPFHRNEFVACFADTAFFSSQMYEDSIQHTWAYEKISRRALPRNSPIIKKRNPFDYDLFKK